MLTSWLAFSTCSMTLSQVMIFRIGPYIRQLWLQNVSTEQCALDSSDASQVYFGQLKKAWVNFHAICFRARRLRTR